MKGNLNSLVLGAVAGTLVISVYWVITANVKGADGGDWLAFAGIFLGVAATISGTLGIDRVKQRLAHRRAIANLLTALDAWKETVATIPIELTKAKIGDLRQQHAYIEMISVELDCEVRTATMAAHMFNFHVPSMIAALEKVLEMEGGAQALLIGHVANEMQSYATTFKRVLSAS